MKISDLPNRSAAAIKLRKLSRAIQRERLRCAQEAMDVGLFSYRLYADEPTQWLRCEQILKAILKDNLARMEWFDADEASRRERRASETLVVRAAMGHREGLSENPSQGGPK